MLTLQRSVYSGDVSIALHVAPVGLRVVRMMPAVYGVLVGVETVRRVQRYAATGLLLVNLL